MNLRILAVLFTLVIPGLVSAKSVVDICDEYQSELGHKSDELWAVTIADFLNWDASKTT